MHRNTVRSLLLPLVFALSYSQSSLYTSNQHTYLLRGLAQGGYGHLDMDWLAGTADPVPLFSWLVKLTYAFLPVEMFHVYYVVILGVYAFSLLGIASHVFAIDRSGALYFICFLTLTALHSPVTGRLTESASGINLAHLFQDGVAGQYLLGSVFQPSVFGVLLVLSMLLFLDDRLLMAGLCAAVAAVFHPTYLVSAGLVFGAMLFPALRARTPWRRILVALILFLVPVAGIAAYTASTFGAAESSTSQAALAILAERVRHHADPAVWFGGASVVKIAAIAAALFLIRGTRLMPVLLVSCVAASVLTVVQVTTGSRGLALLFPWRPSIYLVPLSCSLLAVWALSKTYRFYEGMIPSVNGTRFVAASFLLAALAASGVATYILRQKAQEADPARPLMEYVRTRGERGDLWIVPLGFESFRLETGIPVVADRKSHPLQADEVIEWNARVESISPLYPQAGGPVDCPALLATALRHGVSHIALSADRQAPCDYLEPLHRDPHYAAYGIRDRGTN